MRMQIGFSKKTKDRAFIIAMLALPTMSFLVFYLYVNFNSILLAFQVKEGQNVSWSTENFKQIFKDFSSNGTSTVLLSALKNTFKYFFSDLLIAIPSSFVLCYFLYKKIKGYRVFRVVFYLPHIISATVLTALFRYFIAVNGPIAALMEAWNLGTMEPLFTMSKTATNTIVFYCVFLDLATISFCLVARCQI